MTNHPCSYCGKIHNHSGYGIICDGRPVDYKLPFKVVFQDIVKPRKINFYPRLITLRSS